MATRHGVPMKFSPPRARPGRHGWPDGMNLLPAVARVASHLLAFVGVLAALPQQQVAPAAWLAVYAIGLVFLACAPRHRLYPQAPAWWLRVLLYSVLLAAIFFGADWALNTLGNSVKGRATLPAAFGGLELYAVLAPGVASVALGAWVGALLQAARGGGVDANGVSHQE